MRSCHNVLWEKSLSRGVGQTATPEFTQEQAQEVMDLLRHVADNWHDTEMGEQAESLLKQLEGDDE